MGAILALPLAFGELGLGGVYVFAEVDVQIRDLDQTTIGNPAYDFVRLALSLSSVAPSSDFPGATTARIVENAIEGYRTGLSSPRW